MCVQQRERTEALNGTLGATILVRLDVHFRVRHHVDKVHEVAMVTVLVVRYSRPASWRGRHDTGEVA